MRGTPVTALLFSFIWFTGSAFAQGDRGTITGTVSDPAGAVVAAAAVEAKHLETGAVYDTVASSTGNYTIAQLPAGSYELSVSTPGFKKFLRQGLTVEVAGTLRIDVSLELGSAAESVTVTEAAALLKTESGELSHNVTGQALDDLPVLAIGAAAGSSSVRNPTTVAELVPGTFVNANVNLKVNGAPGNTSSFRVEGQDASNGYVNAVPAQVQPGVDSIQEVTIQTSNFAAEYGQVGGGFFNYTMKSGTNQLHGSLYDYFVNEVLDAGTPFTADPSHPNEHVRTVSRRNDYGFTVGAPVVIPKLYNGHDKTFLFFNWEQFREFETINGQADTVPTLAYRNGNFQTALTGRNLCPTATPGCDPIGRPIMEGTIYDPSTQRLASNGQIIRDPFPNNTIPLANMDPVALKIQALIPLPNVPGAGLVNNGIYPYVSDRVTGIPSFKIDQIISPRHKVSFYFSEIYTGSAYSNTTGGADGLPEPITQAIGTFITSHMYRLNYESTLTPTLLFHFGAGYQDEYFADDKKVTDYNAATQLGLVGATVPRMFPAINGASNAQGGVKNLSSGTNRHIWYQKPTANTSLTWVKNNHTYKFGGEARFEGVPTTLFSDTNGVYAFSANETGLPSTQGQVLQGGTVGMPYASFLLGLVDGAAVQYPPTLKLSKQEWGGFAQDTWKISRKFTLDYGIRYDYGTYPKEEHGLIPNFSPTTPNPAAGGRLGAVIFEGDGPLRCNCDFAHNYPWAFSPRLGVAYQITSKTVLRAGWGVVYNTTPGNNGATANIPNPVTVTSPSFGQPVMTLRNGVPFTPTHWPNFNPGQFPVPGTFNPPKVYIDQNAGRPARQIQWSIGLQQAIGNNLMVEAAYVANRGVWWNAPGLVDVNALTPQTLAADGLDINNAADRQLLASPLNSALAASRGFSTRLPYAGFPVTATVAQSLRPFPQFTSVQELWAPLGKTWYDSLQAKTTKRLSHGLSFTTALTWSRNLTLGQNLDPGNLSLGNAVINNVFNRNQNKYLSDFDQPFQLNTSLTYVVPKPAIGNGMIGKAASWMVRDWTVAVYLGYASGMPIEVPYAQNALNTLLLRNTVSPTSVDGYISTGQPPAQATFANRVPGASLYTVDINCHCFDPNKTFVLNPAAWTQPAAGQWGTSAAFYDDYRFQRRPMENLGVGRTFHFKERAAVSIRAEFTNVFNRARMQDPQFANALATQTKNPAGQNTAGFGWIDTSFGNAGAVGAIQLPRTGTIVGRLTF
ncbi:MAG TPA: TonB-dependent receptor [Bryobacteraceae bacterium]|jgi:hypothetical protein